MDLNTFIEYARLALGDTGTTQEYTDSDLSSYINLAIWGEGYETASECNRRVIPLIISCTKMSAYARRARQLAEEGKYEKSLDTERIKVLVDKEKLAEHYLKLYEMERKYYYQLRHNLLKGTLVSDIDDTTNNDQNWAPEQDEFGTDTTDWGDGEKEGIKF